MWRDSTLATSSLAVGGGMRAKLIAGLLLSKASVSLSFGPRIQNAIYTNKYPAVFCLFFHPLADGET